MMTRILLTVLWCLLPLAAQAQVVVQPVERWLATVDDSTQQITLLWSPSTTPSTLGYHICSGQPCIDYDTVFGRFDTSYVCIGHNPAIPHEYRLYVFDSNYNASALTPPFGPMVLHVDTPPCLREAEISWTPYHKFPNGVPIYHLQVIAYPSDSAFHTIYTTSDSTALHHRYAIPPDASLISTRVIATGDGLESHSAVVQFAPSSVDTATINSIDSLRYDSINSRVMVYMHCEPGFDYALQRNRPPRTEWVTITSFQPDTPTPSFSDDGVSLFDSTICYRLEVSDSCGLHFLHSNTMCITLPAPPAPHCLIPTAIIAGDASNGTFLPRIDGLMGDIYELTIYNRQGLRVYHTTDPTAGWKPGADMPQGAYTYSLRCRYNTGNIKTYAGTVTLIK